MAKSNNYFTGPGPSTVAQGHVRDIINNVNVNPSFGAVSNPSRSETTIRYNLKLPVSSFTGRQYELKELQKVLQCENVETSTSAVIIAIGGTGKTELARKYAQENSIYYKNIVWIDSETAGSILSTFVTLAKDDLHMMVENCHIEVTIRKVYEHLSESKALFIFDNAEGYATVKRFLPPFIKEIKNIHILFTSQIQEWEVMDEGNIKKIYLNDMLPEEAKEFVKKSLNQNDVCDEDIEELIEELAFFPLALRQAVAYINQQHKNTLRFSLYKSYGIADYLTEFRDRTKEVLNYVSEIHHRYAKTVYRTLELTIEKISKENNGKIAIDILKVIAYLAPDDIDIDDIAGYLGYYSNKKQNAIKLLEKYSMIKINGRVSSIHRLLQQVIRVRNQNKEIKNLKTALAFIADGCIISCWDTDDYIHIMFVWSYAIKHRIFFKNVTNYTYGHFDLTPLHLFILYGNYEEAYVILKNVSVEWLRQNCNKRYVECRYGSKRYIYTSNSKLYILKSLIENGFVVNVQNNDGTTQPLEAGRLNRHFDNIKLMLTGCTYFYETDPPNLDETDRTPLHIAAVQNKSLDFIKRLVKNGSNINAIDGAGETPLHKAAAHNQNVDILKFLIESGANVNALNKIGETPFYKAAAQNPNVDILKFLIQSGANIHDKNDYAKTVLHKVAKRNQNVDILKFLIQSGANVNDVDALGATPLHRATLGNCKSLDFMNYLIENGADINAIDKKGFTALHYNCADKNYWRDKTGSYSVTGWLIEKGANVIAKDYNGETALHLVVRRENTDMINCLIEKGADVNAKDNNGKTTLHIAASQYSNMDVINYLIEKGADVNAKDNNGKTALDVAVHNEIKENIDCLIENGAKKTVGCRIS